LQDLVLTSNQLSGPLPPTLSRLTSLTKLDLSFNQISGPLPTTLIFATALSHLDLSSNLFSGSLPLAYSRLSQLSNLALSSNLLSGSIPEPLIATLTRALQLSMSNNQLSGNMPSSLSRLTKLTNLNLSFNRLSGTVVSSISTLSALELLALSNNAFTETIPAAAIAQITKLQKLDLSYNQLSGTVPAAVTALDAITSIDLSHNDLTGPLPTSISIMADLKSLNLSGNSLTGSIPSHYSALTNLEALNLCCNRLNGTLPTFLGGLLKLEAIDLSSNRLSGTIPVLYTGLVRLTLLNLRNNQLTGPVLEPIPASLTSYRLDNNYFSSGFSSPPNCAQGTITFRFNCLDTATLPGYTCPTPADPTGTAAAVQRAEVLCAAFCGVSAAAPPCGGHGSCYLEGSSRVPTCDCDPGFVNGELPASCVAEGSKEGALVALQPTAAQTGVKGGAAVASNGAITLTASQPNTWGAAFFIVPVNLFSFSLKAGACGRTFAFTVYFSFTILKPAAAAAAGDGFAFVIAASDAATGGSSGSTDGSGGGGSLGYSGMDERSIAIEFETVKTTDSNDPDSNHVGFSARGNTTSIVTAKAPVTLNDGKPKHAWIVFDPSPPSSSSSAASTSSAGSSASSNSTGSLHVFLSGKASPRPAKPALSVQVSLCEFLRPTLIESAFRMGFAASSSDPPQQHSVLFWNISAGLQEPAPLTGQQFGFRISESSISPGGANPFFRYASAGVQAAGGGGGDEEVWVVSEAFSWTGPSMLWPVKNQGACGDCWAYAVVGSIEAAYSILFNLSAAPLLSVTYLRSALGSSCDQGNSPSQAFQYLVTLNAKSKVGLTEDGKEAAVAKGGKKKKGGSPSPLCSVPVFGQLLKSLGISCTGGRDSGSSKLSGGRFRVDGFERTAFHGWFGLLLAVQRQPVVVHIEATAPSFLDYDGLFKYQDPECFSYNLNHVVLLVGYRLIGFDPTFPHMVPPFWIIRNSWGPEWGDRGHMRMDIQGGDGVCGINTLPGIYPVVRDAADPCNLQGRSSEVFGSLFNPCGSFKCTPDGASNRCDCNDPRFVEAKNADGSRTCAYKDACRASVHNPCAVGTCVNDGKGSYSCVCPPGFRQGTTVDGTFSCGPGDPSSTYKVVSEGLTCADIHPVYGLTLIQFQQQNPKLDCSAPLPDTTVVNVRQMDSLTPCSVYYTTSQGDTCESLAAYFSLSTGCPTDQPCTDAFQALNPGLDCATNSGQLSPSQAVCVERRAQSAASLLIPVCSQYFLVQAGETCEQIRSVPSTPLTPLEFFRLNPGIKCSRLVPKTDIGSFTGFEACIGSSLSFTAGVCPRSQAYVVGTGDRCTALQIKYFKGIKGCYKRINGYECLDRLITTTRVCIPDQVKIKKGRCTV
ncbi:hypothetical protein CLOP_g24416, partial [Closterium sp. NIES-67]